ncbi:uncharacterized protein LOC125198554 [Salvia hispanica]|uniref:uncharacterized protein LOC125198554 n=1 Tax=Salvia hispanica TaxID=49212 RepID=UPI0020096A81|nr:uncharacterized protein LOC125198554 [Salvia hispanica]
MTKATDGYSLLPDEDEPYRSCKSKRFITKVMFMCAVCRPVFGARMGRPNLMERWAKWPDWASKEIYIQQDNVTPHINSVDLEFEDVANSDGFKIQLICQLANSPDTNILDLDLGFSRAIQTLQHEKPCSTVDELLGNVCSSYEELSPQTLNKVFLSLRACLTQILIFSGGNNYKVPHINKDRLKRTEGLPNALDVDEKLVRDVLEYLQLPENNAGGAYDIGPLSTAFGF